MLPVWELQISLFADDDVTPGLVVVWELSFRDLGAVVAPDPNLLASWTNDRRDSLVREGVERRGKKREKPFKRWERGRDGCFPMVCFPTVRVDIPVLGDEGYLVVSSACS